MPAATHSEGCLAKKIKLWMCVSKLSSVPKAGFFWSPRCIACHEGVTMRPCHSKELTETLVQKGAFQDHREVSKGVWSCPITAFQMHQRQGLVISRQGLRLSCRKARTKSNCFSLWIIKWAMQPPHHRHDDQALLGPVFIRLFCVFFSNESRKYTKPLTSREPKSGPFSLCCMLAFVQWTIKEAECVCVC